MSTTRIGRFSLAARLSLCALLATLLAVLAVTETPTAFAQPNETGDGDEVVTQSEDLTGDTVDDTVTASPDGDGTGTTAGQVNIASGSDGSTATLKGNEEGDKFGQDVALVGPDANGINHLLIGAPYEADTGRAYFFTGPFEYEAGTEVPTSEALFVLQSDFAPTDDTTVLDYAFGHRVGALFDVDGDAVLELRVASMWNNGGVEVELMHVFSGATAELLFITVASDTFDPWVELPGDLNLDGLVDQTDVDMMLEAVAAGGLSDPAVYDLNGDGNVDALDVALVLDSVGLVVLQAYLNGDGDGVGVFDADGGKVSSYFRRAPGDGGICCCGRPEDCGPALCDCRPCPELPCGPQPGPCSESNPCSAECSDRDCKPECGGDPCSPDCPDSDCNPACGGDPCAPGCEDSGFPCDDPCITDPCGPDCADAPCDPNCGGDPCAFDCDSAPCNPDCGGGPCAPDCPNPPCQNLELCDEDETPEYACVGEERTFTAPECPLACQQNCTPGEWQWDFADPGDELIAEIITDPPIGDTIIVHFNAPGEIGLVADNGCCAVAMDVVGVTVDLDIDSDNNNGYGLPDRSEQEDDIENGAGIKVLIVNRNDDDDDYVPDYADWSNVEERFVPIVLNLDGLASLENAEVSFDYDAAHPSDVTQTVVPVPDIQSSYVRYGRGSGKLRIWTADGSSPRTTAEFIDSGQPLDLAAVTGETTFYIEAVNGSPTASTVTINLTLPDGSLCLDTVRVLPFDSLTDVNESEIIGFTIIRDTTDAVGTPGRDIIIGTESSDTIAGGAGDDIIVAGFGDDLIDPGAGSDVIFASKGHNITGPGATGEPALTSPPGDEGAFFDEEDAPFTSEQVLQAYRMMYGEEDPWLDIFLSDDVGGIVEAVEGDGWWWSKTDWDNRSHLGENGDNVRKIVIEVEFSHGSPFVAAAHVREEILDIATSSLYGAAGEFSAAFLEDAFEKAVSQEPFDEELDTYQELRQAAIANAAEVTAIVTNLYVSGIGIASEGADFVLTLSEVTDGNALAAIGFLPFVPATVTRSGRVFLKWAGDTQFEKVTDLARKSHIAKGADSGIGFVLRRGMPWEEFTAVDGSVCLRLGTAQEVFEKYGSTAHANTVLRISEDLARTGQYEYITMNRAWKTAVADNPPITGLTTRPDILAIRRDGKVDAIEVVSNGQDEEQLLLRLQAERLSLPEQYRGEVSVEPLDPP